MMAMVNGMAAHGGLIPFGSTFFVFSDYCRPALRLGALMGVHSLYVFTHDSVGLGEDGPTHQPIEHLMALRAIPHADGLPSGGCERDGGVLEAGAGAEVAELYGAEPAGPAGVRRGADVCGAGEGRVLDDAEVAKPDVILIGTGSRGDGVREGGGGAEGARGLRRAWCRCRASSIFDEQPAEYKAELLPEATPKMSVEAGATMGWWKYVGHNGAVIGIDRFGASAPGTIALDKLGINVAHVVETAKGLVKK